MSGYIKMKYCNDKYAAITAPLNSELKYNMDLSTRDSKKNIKAFNQNKLKLNQNLKDFSGLYYLPQVIITASGSLSGGGGLCEGCNNLIYIDSISSAEGITPNCFSMFSNCNSLRGIGNFSIDTSKSSSFYGMFDSCTKLTTIPELDLSSGNYFNRIFMSCRSLDTIEKLIFNSAKTSVMKDMFWYCGKLTNIIIEGTIKVDSNDLDLHYCQRLTVDSLMSFINAFEDNTGEETQYTVTIGATNLTKLTADQIAVATNKNILLA